MMESKGQPKENRMGTMPIGRLLVSVSLPIVLSMLVQALYNVVDSIFVARLGEDALAAVSLVFPVQNLMIAAIVGTAVGMNSLLSRRLGEKDFAAANHAATNGLFLTLCTWVVFVVLGLLFTKPFFAGYADMGGEIAAMGQQYMYIVTIGSLGLFMSVTGERLLQSTGLSFYSMVGQMVGAVTNIILDPIMIFGLFGFPALGVAGAAWATIIGQCFSMVMAFYFNITKNKEIQLKFRGFRPSWNTIVNIYKVGLPSIMMQSLGSVMVYTLNYILAVFGTTPVSVLGVYFKLQSFVFMPVFGFNSGMIPVIGYNYGAKNPERIRQTVRIGVLIVFGIMVAGTLLFWLAPNNLLALFDANENMLAIGVPALRIISLSFPMAAISIAFSGVFQALGLGLYSLIMSLVRQMVFLLPLAFLLARVSGMPALWAAFPIAEVFAVLMAIAFFRQAWRRYITPLVAAKAGSPATGSIAAAPAAADAPEAAPALEDTAAQE